MRRLGIVAHSAEGAALCFLTACHEGESHLGTHMHPEIVLSAVPMGASLAAWQRGDLVEVAKHLARGVRQVADAGAEFWVCPDNTAHIALERIAPDLPIPGLHIARVVCREIATHDWKHVGLLGTEWTMTGPVYARELRKRGLRLSIPDESMRERLHAAIFDELCPGTFDERTTELFLTAIDRLRSEGADCVILGCTEIPLVVTQESSPLPVLASTRLLAVHAVRHALDPRPLPATSGWLEEPRFGH